MSCFIALHNHISVRRHLHSSRAGTATHHWPLLQRVLLIPLRECLDDSFWARVGFYARHKRLLEQRVIEGSTPAIRMAVDVATYLGEELCLGVPQPSADEGGAWFAVDVVDCVGALAASS